MLAARAATPLILTALTAVAAGCVLVVLATPGPTPSGLAAGQEPRTVEVTRQSFTDERTVEVDVHVDADQTVTAHAAGMVTSTACSAGKRLRSGRPVMRINDRPVVALHTTVPFYRSLQPGDRGRDVSALQAELHRLGYPVSVTGRYQRSTVLAVKRLLSEAGVDRPDGGLSLGDVVWLARKWVVPTSCSAQPGQTINPGDPVATAAGRLTAISYPIPDQLHAGPRTLTLFGVTSPSASATGEISDARFLTKVAATKGYLVARSNKDGQRPTGSLALTTPIMALKVPPTALASLDGQHGCVQQDGVNIAVEIIGSGLGAALIRPVNPQVDLNRVNLGIGQDQARCASTPRPEKTP